MKSLFKNLKAIAQPAWKSIPGISVSLCTSLLTIGTSVGIGITFNPERSWAGSTCAGVYSSRSGSPSLIGYYNSISKSYVNVATYAGSTNINAIATQPSTGNLFFVDRVTGKTTVYNPNTGSQTVLTGTLPGNTGFIIGATFNPSGKLYVYYGDNTTLIEVDPSTGGQVGSTINISGIPGNSGGGTNGDIAIGTDGVLYAIGDTSSSGSNFTSQLYSIAIAGTTATATPVNGNNNISGVSGAAVNGLAIDPSTNKFYISTNLGTYELDFATKVGTLLTSATGTNDLAACGSPTPDLPTINKSFSPDTITGIPATSTLTLTLGNTNLVPIYLIQALTDNFQSGLKVSTPNGLSGTCTTIPGNTVTATVGTASISLNDGFKIPAGGCTVSVNVTANSAGTYTNNIPAGALKTFVGDNANAASSTLVVSTITTSTISGTLYEDSDGGDDLDASEPKLPAAIKVTLYKDNNSNNTIDTGEEVANTLTNDQGQYTFNNVAADTYKVKVDTSDSDIPNGLTLGTSNDLTVTVSGAAVNNINFGFDRAQVSFDPDPPNPEADPNPPAGICAAPGSDGTLTISGVVNSYYPGTQSVSAGATQITLGTATGLNSGIKKGDKLLIIQMQDAEINSTNTDAYGNGNPGGAGSGSTAFYTSGYYEYVVANNTVSPTGGNLEITTPLAYTFTNADATSTRGQRRFQVIRLPQYRNATISGTVTAAPWNGRSGGIVAVDVADTLTFSGAGKIDVSGQGFRGGGARNTTGTGGAAQSLPGNTDYVSLSTNPYHGSKGEGIAGTPKYIRNDVTTTVTVNSDEGYPNGSFGRGAPGNAGGGSTDPNIEHNSANTGGGGGANRGFGGKGGDSWTDGYGRQPVGGFGGQAFLTTVNRIVMGGGGGAGTANDSATGNVPSGGGGGGIVIVRTGKIAGTGIIEANGIQGVEPSGTDGGGGGGAAGTVLIQSVTPSTPNLTINARGGKGLDSGYQEHGPGGGGGGGYIAFKGVTPVIDVSAGQPGNDKAGGTVNPAPDPYGATAGANGLAEAATIPAAGVKPGAECFSNNPNVLLVKRITRINNQTQNQGSDDLAAYKDQDTNPYDDNNITITNPNPPVEPADTDKWPDPNTFLIGGINGGNVKPGDEIEYTIYFLSAGETTAKNVLICDRIPENATFIPTAFNSFPTKNTTGLPSGDRGIIWQNNGATESLTNISDGDTAEYLSPGVDPTIKYPGIKCDGSNTNGVVVVNLGNLPNAIAPGTPTSSYGFIRFQGRIK